MAVQLEIVDDVLDLRLTGAQAALSLRRRLRVPVSAVRGIAVLPRDQVPRSGFRLPGTSVPGLVRAGSYRVGASRELWCVGRGPELLVVQLEPGQSYRRWVLEVDDPQADLARLRPVLGALVL